MLLKLRSSIRPELKRSYLMRGSFLAGIGAFLILVVGITLPPSQMKLWGLPTLIVGLLFIGIGLLPYRYLTKLEIQPYELHYDGVTLFFLKKGKVVLEIPESAIASLAFVEKGALYGFCIRLKDSQQKKVKVHENSFDFTAFSIDANPGFENCDLFLPYFTKVALQELNEARIEEETQ